MPRNVPLRTLKETLHCTTLGFRPWDSNSFWHHERAKTPRSSLLSSRLTSTTCASLVGRKIIATVYSACGPSDQDDVLQKPNGSFPKAGRFSRHRNCPKHMQNHLPIGTDAAT